jgi:hypothetical protein
MTPYSDLPRLENKGSEGDAVKMNCLMSLALHLSGHPVLTIDHHSTNRMVLTGIVRGIDSQMSSRRNRMPIVLSRGLRISRRVSQLVTIRCRKRTEPG